MKRSLLFLPALLISCALNSNNEKTVDSINELSSKIDDIQLKIFKIEQYMVKGDKNRLPSLPDGLSNKTESYLQTTEDILNEYERLYAINKYETPRDKTKAFTWLLEKKHTYISLLYDQKRLAYTKSMYDLDDLLMASSRFAEVPGYIFSDFGKLEPLYHKFTNETISIRKELISLLTINNKHTK